MAYSDNALAFSQIPASHQIRLEDRISFAYLEYANIIQNRTGVVALGTSEGKFEKLVIQIPAAAISVLCLGPGTSITQAAVTSCTRAGATIIFSGGGGVPAYSHATPLTSSAKWAIAQARLVSNERHQRTAAIYLYKKQFGLDDFPGGSIRSMRGMEGRMMRNTYQNLARKYRISGFKRRVTAGDPVNNSLNIANSILYGCGAAACAALGLNPALGVIHRGDARSMLYDLADLYKPTIAIPAAFEGAQSEDFAKATRTIMRSALVRDQILEGMLEALMTILEPHLPSRDDDRLIGDNEDSEVAGHIQYALLDDGEV